MTYVVFNPCFPSKSTVVRRRVSPLYAQIRDKLSNMSMAQAIRALRDFFRLMVKERKILIKYSKVNLGNYLSCDSHWIRTGLLTKIYSSG